MILSPRFAPPGANPFAEKWLACLRREPAATFRLWCFPGTGSGSALWQPLATRLASRVEIVALCLAGREARLTEAPATRMRDLVEPIAEVIATRGDMPAVLCGHSLGGLVAFEVARQLRAWRVPAPAGLIACSCRAPHRPPLQPLLHNLPRREFIAAITRRYGVIPHEIAAHPEVLELLIGALRADLEISETYGPSTERLDIPLLCLGASDDHVIAADLLKPWRHHTRAAFAAEFLPGGHFFVQDAPEAAARRIDVFLRTLPPPPAPATLNAPWAAAGRFARACAA
jgi:surfactin synthase thioesterase subunit